MQSEKIELSGFLSAARNFCAFIESTKPETPKDFLSNIQSILLELYQFGGRLPDAEVTDRDFEELLTDHDHKIILENIGRRCPFQYYWTIIDPFNFNDASQQLGTGDILDDLGDIYRDLKRALLLYDSGLKNAQITAVWQMKFSFDAHCATHCIDGIKAIHDYLTQE